MPRPTARAGNAASATGHPSGGPAATEHLLTARCVVNATGPWAAAIPHSRLRLRLTKGVHLVVDRQRLPLPCAVVMTAGPRILFGIPWGERMILGTTDTDYEGPPEAVSADDGDVAYILEIVNASFPAAALDSRRRDPYLGRPASADRQREGRAVGHFPRPPDPHARARLVRRGRRQADDLSPDCPAGGRSDCALPGRRAGPCRTATEPLLPPDREGTPSSIFPPPVCADLVEHYCRCEWAMHLNDVMVRRTSWHYYHADAAKIAVEVADWMAGVLGWDAARRAAEIEQYGRLLKL